MDAALEVFDEKGYSKTTLADISTRAGVTRGAVYWHFKDKVDILAKLKGQIDDEIEEILDEPTAPEELGSIDEMVDYIRNYFLLLENDERYLKYFRMTKYKVEFIEEMQGIIDVERKEQSEYLLLLEKSIKLLQKKGKASKSIDPARSSKGIIAFAWGIIEMWVLESGSITLSGDGFVMLNEYLDTMRP